MNRRNLLKWYLGANVILLSGALVPRQVVAESPPALDQSATVESSKTGEALTPVAEDALPPSDTDAPATLVSTNKPVPANIRPGGPVSEVIKLANSGVDESVMLAFVTNSIHTFNLAAEEIIYLNDIGVPGPVVTAMIQRDQELKTSLAAGANAPTQQSGPPSSGATPPPPGQEQNVPPPPENTASYAVEAPLTPPDAGTEEMFYDSLAPYGNWVDVAGYGRCWQPTVVVATPFWQPYYNCGHWVYSDCGWYWLSDYSWGWAPFHYGTWFHHGHLGWCWVPGKVWGPSWVSWRYTDHYCGWAPLPPGCHFVAGVGLTFHGQRVMDRDDFGLRPGHYSFVAWDHFHDRQFRPSHLPAAETEKAYAHSTVATRITGDNHTVINNGLPVSRVAAATHRPIHTVALRETTEPAAAGGRAERFDVGGQTLVVSRRPAPVATTGGPAWAPRSGLVQGPGTHQSSSLILRGAQSSAYKESTPPNSLVVVGHGNRGQPSVPSQPSSLSAPSAQSAAPSSKSWDRPVATIGKQPPTVPQERPSIPYQNQQQSWMGTVSSSPQPSWFVGNGSRPVTSSSSVGQTRPEARTYQPLQNYQPAQRPITTEVPRYSTTPSYVPQRSYSAPAPAARSPSYESRPAPSAPSAPAASAAPAPSSSSHSQSSSSGSNSRQGR